MFPMLREVVALSIATALSTEQSITPLAATDCRAIANTISQAVGIPLTTKEGKPEFPSGLRKKLNAALKGWTPVTDYDADGPDSTVTGFAKASQRVVYLLESELPRGTCENVPLVACKVPHQRWNWSLKVVGFSQ
jgi:hypothetical protein